MKYFDQILVALLCVFFAVIFFVARRMSASERGRLRGVRKFQNHVREIGERQEVEKR